MQPAWMVNGEMGVTRGPTWGPNRPRLHDQHDQARPSTTKHGLTCLWIWSAGGCAVAMLAGWAVASDASPQASIRQRHATQHDAGRGGRSGAAPDQNARRSMNKRLRGRARPVAGQRYKPGTCYSRKKPADATSSSNHCLVAARPP